ncbi:hypothetical protein [Xanthomonas campestris]|uniref:hypothetical protein n=1 Tax=Xanthomonas campestris TaxID=339 RepID=UPI000E1EB985|nr:hypothetical protein [Xanthomonas campestris]
MSTDELSRIAGRSIDVLTIAHPVRTALGIMLGVIFMFIQALFRPIFLEVKYIDVDAISWWHFAAIGIFIAHFQTFRRMISTSSVGHEKIDDAFWAIKKSGLPKVEQRAQIRRLVNQIVEDARLSKETLLKVRGIESQMDANQPKPGAHEHQ